MSHRKSHKVVFQSLRTSYFVWSMNIIIKRDLDLDPQILKKNLGSTLQFQAPDTRREATTVLMIRK
jgi:hypothetical protein